MSQDKFLESISRFKFSATSLSTYSDSLKVALMADLQDWKNMRVAHLQITYTWERAERHLWIPADQLKDQSLYKHPYALIHAIRSSNQAPEVEKILIQSRDTLSKVFKDKKFEMMSNDSILKFAFSNHPDNLLRKMLQ